MLDKTEKEYFESLVWEKINPIRERHFSELEKIGSTRGAGNSPAPYTHAVRQFKKALAEARIQAYIETYRRVGRYPDEGEFDEFADELFKILDSRGNNLPRQFRGALSPFPPELVEKIEEQLSAEIRQDVGIALSSLHHFIREGKLEALQKERKNQPTGTVELNEHFTEFQKLSGRTYNVLSDLHWDVIKDFIERIPSDIERVDFLQNLKKLPDDGVVNGIITNPTLHRRNQESVLRPLRHECTELLSRHFNLEAILQKAEQITDHGEAVAYLWKVLRAYKKYHPSTLQGSYQPDELAFCKTIDAEIQHRKDLRGSFMIGNQSNFKAEGDLVMGDSYKAGQAGAIGPNAHAHDMTFNQVWNQLQGSVNLSDLANQLAKLRQEMKKEAVEPEHDIAVAEIAKAEQAAKEGDGSKTIEHLKSAGKWALDVGTKIGTSLAVEVLKEATGLKHSSPS